MHLSIEGLLRTYQIISLIENWYAFFIPLEIDEVFFNEMEMGFANIGMIGRRFLHSQNL